MVVLHMRPWLDLNKTWINTEPMAGGGTRGGAGGRAPPPYLSRCGASSTVCAAEAADWR